MTGPRLVCLLPVRNGETDLPGWLESAERFADAVVALDDGSTDGTRDLLAAHPLVTRTLTNPVRPTYRGWDDAGNRNRLLAEAADLDPLWVFSLDADERLDEPDASALREFVSGEAIPGLAYGFRVVRMIGSSDAYDRDSLWVYRLFGHETGARFPEQRLHFVPIPTSIPRRRWVKTSLRIMHLASLTEERRTARFRKYEEADPNHRFQRGYTNLLTPPGEVRPWVPRRPGERVLIGAGPPSSDEHDPERPVLSAIIIARDDHATIARSVQAALDQECPAPFEVIVVVSGSERTAEVVRKRFPQVRLVTIEDPVLPGAARNAGLAVARGDYVSFPGSHVVLTPGSLPARLRAHEAGWSMVTGTLVNGNRTPAGWAAYFLDHSNALPGRPSGELSTAPASCSYVRFLLDEVGGFPEDRRTGEDTVVNRELYRRGYVAYRERSVTLTHASPCRTRRSLIAHQFRRGRGLGRIILEGRTRPGLLRDRGFRRRMWVRYVSERLAWTDRNLDSWGEESRKEYRAVRLLVRVGIVAAWLGAWTEILRPRRGKGALLFGAARPGEFVGEPVPGASSVQVLTTGYCPCDVCCEEWADGITALGVDTTQQVKGVAADLSLVPPWTRLDVPGYGPAVVDDTGSMMRASARDGIVHLDLRFLTHDEALRWGRRWMVVEIPGAAPAARMHASAPDVLHPGLQ
jgi:glycosyltransferase involved in cell wall biosynthesis/3D (Asp-Asp-Asp) domain-containing protein